MTEQELDILYPEVDVQLCVGDEAITVEGAKELLGWTPESTNKYNNDYTVLGPDGVKVRCYNNMSNRPIYRSNVENLKQEHLHNRWQFNAEPIIVGRYGSILNGQHSLIALIFADYEYQKDPERWRQYRSKTPTMDKLVVFGVSEDDFVVNTMDTCKPRSLMDVIYRSRYFENLKMKDRRLAARMADAAVRQLWHRIGLTIDAFGVRRTHSECLSFIAEHPRVLECIIRVMETSPKGELNEFLSPGYFASILYLMGSSTSDRDTYIGCRNEESLDWKHWEIACDFIDALADNLQSIRQVTKAIRELNRDGLGKYEHRMAVLAKAWIRFVEGASIRASDLVLDWTYNESEVRILAEVPTFGGIDIGDPKREE